MSTAPVVSESAHTTPPPTLEYISYRDEHDLEALNELIEKDLSEPYSIFTYRYFLNKWPELCIMCIDRCVDKIIGCVVCKLDEHHPKLNDTTNNDVKQQQQSTQRGYIAMLAVEASYRGQHIASHMVQLALERMHQMGADECVLEAEITNTAALGLYRKLGFIKTKRLTRYYLNGSDAYRLKYFFMENPTTTNDEEEKDKSDNITTTDKAIDDNKTTDDTKQE
ncbi:N-acetyltransferase, putative [Perkinsus marinus ATCC 50983]|uniref:N-acetyltransferase, putative n=1 Tax=Perkinsus marinus (strain ATCC 50983 / TXsc) TaxID=423536 RepID=C5KDL0_PERM5|nr:N-acetyltransferase, putative [Perkinsus marinus ATCC 50983]EER17313.1 N-acetyltransferase, putative [Perkinsus marinus ATCC 50983]|eukprot:XP_002785517.1 N-acetyltransferase, putative [Perkinsus marinus ATCC 50983]